MTPYYQDAAVTIYHGDCRQIVPSLGRFDLLLTDPPYGIGENALRVASRTKAAKTTDYGSFEWDAAPPERWEIEMCLAAAGRAIIWGGNYFHLPPARGWLVWDKQNSGNFADCELAWTNLKMSVRMFSFLWNGMIRAGEARGVPRCHPTQKPVELMRWCLTWDEDAKTVLDPYAGSGTTGRACKDLGRKCVMIEREEKNCETAARRMGQEVLSL